MQKDSFSARHHLPKYSLILLRTLFSPAILFFIIAGNFVLFACLAVFYKYEHGINPAVTSFFDLLWFGISTVTTVGYGDITPLTVEGKISAMILMILGASFFVGFTSMWVTSFLTEEAKDLVRESQVLLDSKEEILREIRKLNERLDKIK